MLLPIIKEREYRFKLALRIGLPIFALIVTFISHTLISSYDVLQPAFYFEAVLLLTFAIYFIFYLIYRGFDIKITDEVTKTFTKEYFYDYVKKELDKEKHYTLVLISIKNLNDINSRYGIKNGDKVLRKVASYVGKYLKDKDIKNFPMGHVSGGKFILGLKGKKSLYKTIFELMSLKYEEFKVDDIEVKVSISMVDTLFSNELDYMVEYLFQSRDDIKDTNDDDINPNELDSFIISAIKNKSFLLSTQSVFENDKCVIKECFVKLKTINNKILYPKKYMKVINRLGLSVDFDLMIIEKSVNECVEIDETVFAITVSPSSLRNRYFLSKLKEIFSNHIGIRKKIMFILNETEYYSQIDRYKNTIDFLREMGILIAIDKLGSNHTSFLYLRDLNIDVVRFDSYYAKNIKNKSIVDGFNIMAHEKNVKTWIKKVESQEIKSYAQEIGVDCIQGKYLAPLEIRDGG
jgi:EAL domain-containing protein (putative c-di-GMP-specific phosphodiesterase class I)/GGDEF domain-containing protein